MYKIKHLSPRQYKLLRRLEVKPATFEDARKIDNRTLYSLYTRGYAIIHQNHFFISPSGLAILDLFRQVRINRLHDRALAKSLRKLTNAGKIVKFKKAS